MRVHYHARVWSDPVRAVIVAALLLSAAAHPSQESSPPPGDNPKTEPQYQEVFSGPIVELTAEHITVARSILGKPAENRTFLIKPDTKVEGKLKVKTKVTVGFVKTEEGDVARLIVVRPAKK